MASNHHHFTEEEKEFIKSIFDDCSSYNDLTKKFNEKFGLNLKSYSLSDLCCKRMKLKRNENNGKFKKGYNNQNKMPIGTEINKNGYIWIKVNDIHFEGKIDNKKYKINWMPKHKYIYEQHYGKIPEGYFGAIFARSGLASKQGLRPANCVGVVDSDYRGEFMIALHNDTDEERVIAGKERIAQMVVMPYLSVEFEEVETLNETERGEGGFGSTGRK